MHEVALCQSLVEIICEQQRQGGFSQVRRVIVEVGGEFLWEQVRPWLSTFAKDLPFDAIAVNQELLDRLDREENRLAETNENPYSFEWLVRNNMLDCQRELSPLDKKWFGRFVYRDRHLNRKWNNVLQKKYHKR